MGDQTDRPKYIKVVNNKYQINWGYREVTGKLQPKKIMFAKDDESTTEDPIQDNHSINPRMIKW